MRQTNLVTTGTEQEEAASALLQTQLTDAVNTGIVTNADRSAAMLKDPLFERKKEQGTESGPLVKRKLQEGASATDDLLTNRTINHAEDVFTSSEAAQMHSRLKIYGKDMIAGKAMETVLDDTELDQVEDTYYAQKNARRALRKAKALLHRDNNSTDPVERNSSLGKLTEKNYQRPHSAQEDFRQYQANRNQAVSRQLAAEKGTAGTALGAAGGTGLTGAQTVGGGSGGLVAAGGALAAVFLVIVLLLGSIFLFPVLISGSSENDIIGGNLTENEMIVYSYFHERGLSDVAIAAMLGNMWQESGCDPACYQVGGPGRGLLQWEEGSSRFNRLCNRAAAAGKTWKDIHVQLDFIWAEAESQFNAYTGHGVYTYPNGAQAWWPEKYTFMADSSRVWGKLKDVELATEIFERVYTRASIPNMQNRIGHAKSLLSSDGKMTIGGNDIVTRAQSQLGKPYVWGACGPNSYDCSGLVSYACTGKFVHTYTTTTIMSSPHFKRISASEAKPGDIICNSTHTGIYIGKGQMIHAPQPGDVVKIGDYSWMRGYYYYRYIP